MDEADDDTMTQPRARRATIVDVAAAAGVSVASASKALRNAYGVSAEMKERVQRAIAELNYRPSHAARAMRGRTFTIGLTVADIDNQFVGLLVEGITEVLASTSYDLLIGPAHNGEAPHSRMMDAMLDHHMDGLILFSPYASPEKLADVARQVPTVVVSRHGLAEEYDTVASDDIAGAQMVVDHLVGLGHTRIAFLGHDDGENTDPLSPQSTRERGYRIAMLHHGLESEIDVISTSWSHRGGQLAGSQLLGRTSRPTAVFAGADVAALGLMSSFWDRGLSIPDDLSVVGYDNVSLAALPPISLSSVDQHARDLGAEAAKALLQRIEGRRDSVQIIEPVRLEVRRSSAPLESRLATTRGT